MRLTLRTLLAYMDEILEPGDREELAKKVESSEFAHDLIHRTKDTMRRLRLSAPQVVGTGMGLDPNTVAEYLDNMLPPDSVADFERICLESDVHLAEVASAHHVLTMVLGEPAEVDPAARQRMYALPTELDERKHHRVEPAHTYTAPAAAHDYSAVTPPPHVYPPNSVARPTHTAGEAVPDYLRASAWTRHGTLIAACAAVLLLAISWMIYTSMTGWFGGPQQVAAVSANDKAADLEPPAVPPLQPPAVPAEAAEAAMAEAVETTIEEIGASPSMSGAPPRLQLPAMTSAVSAPVMEEPAPAMPEETPAVVATDETAYGYGDATVEETFESAEPMEPVALPETATSNIAPAATDLASSTPVPPQTMPEVVPPAVDVAPARDVALPAAGLPATETDITDAASSEVADAVAAEPVEIGTYLDGKSVLLRFDAQAGAWFRMSPRAAIYPGDKLLALPAFFPKLTLTSGFHLKLVGGTMVTFGAVDASNTPALSVDYGQVVIVNTTNDPSNMKLTIGGDTADVEFGRNATLAVDVVPKYVPGEDPRKSPAPIVAELYARDGEVVWNDAAGAKKVSAPAEWKIEGGVPSTLTAEGKFPDWIDQEPVEQRSEKLFGAPAVEAALDPTRPVEEQLLELYQSSRRREVKSLVARSSVYAGLFVPFVEALRDSDQKSAWKTHIDTLRSAMSLGPKSAERIYQTLVDQRGQTAAADLYQMLCGYGAEQIGTPEEFRSGLATQLVDWMENDSLDYRVLAVQDMGEISGMRLMPNPAGAPSERGRGIRLWRQRIKSGEVAPVTP